MTRPLYDAKNTALVLFREEFFLLIANQLLSVKFVAIKAIYIRSTVWKYLEFQGSKTELFLSDREVVGEEIKKHFKVSATLLPFDKGTKTDASYRLLRYSSKWNQHIDVTSCSDVQDKDHLLVIKCTNEVSILWNVEYTRTI